jgi:hypothetical protein
MTKPFGDKAYNHHLYPHTAVNHHKRVNPPDARWIQRGARLLAAIACPNTPQSQFTSVSDLTTAGYEVDETDWYRVNDYWCKYSYNLVIFLSF